MGFLSELWALASETPDEKRARLREQGAVTRRKPRYAPPPTNHPDDHYGFGGLDAYAAKKPKGKK